MTAIPKAFSKKALQPIYEQIEHVRAVNPPLPPAPKRSARDIKADELRAHFSGVHAELCRALSWIRQPGEETFSTFKVDRGSQDQAKALSIAKRFSSRLLDRVLDDKHAEAGILFLGFTGTGKTLLSKAILHDLAARKTPGFFLPASEYFDLYTPSFSARLDAPLWKIRQWLASTACLVIDEVGVSAWTDARKDRLQQILDLRSANRLPTVVTTNLNANDFAAAGAERISSRFDQLLYPIACTWQDYRKRTALKSFKPEEVF